MIVHEEDVQVKKRGRPKKEKTERHVIQIRVDESMLDRMLKAKNDTSIYGRCEFVRILIGEALKKRGF